MVRICTIVYVILLFPTVFAQYSLTVLRQPPGPGAITGLSGCGSVLYICGYSPGGPGFAARSTNLGKTWNSLSSPFITNRSPAAISFPTNEIGYIALGNGVVCKTTSGGVLWTRVGDTTIYHGTCTDMVFTSPTTGFMCGNTFLGYIVMRTYNGGEVWEPVPTPVSTNAGSMVWLDSLRGWVAGAGGRILRTTDGGGNWNVMNPGGITLNSIRYAGSGVFYAVGTGSLVKSTDGGETFFSIAPPSRGPMRSCIFSDAQNGCVAGEAGIVYFTTDGGVHWTERKAGQESLTLSCSSNGRYFMAGGAGVVLQVEPHSGSFTALSNDSRTCYGMSSENNSLYICGANGVVRRTTDAGMNWENFITPFTGSLKDVISINNHLCAAGDSSVILQSEDNGVSWVKNTIGSVTDCFVRLCLVDSTCLYVFSRDGVIRVSSNYGASWQQINYIPSACLISARMLNRNYGLAFDKTNKVYRTYDGWLTYETNTLAELQVPVTAYCMLDSLRGAACGGYGHVFYTSNGFRSVNLISDTSGMKNITFTGVAAVSSTDIWAVGGTNIIYHSDAGNIVRLWAEVDCNTVSAYCSPEGEVFITGENGYVFRVRKKITPVELMYCRYDSGMLAWSMGAVTDIREFSIEVSNDGKIWSLDGIVSARAEGLLQQEYRWKLIHASPVIIRLRGIETTGFKRTLAELSTKDADCSGVELQQCYPNPANPSTVIQYYIPRPMRVTLNLYTIQGERVLVLIDKEQEAGVHQLLLNTSGLSSGVYIYQLQADTFRQSKKIVIIK
ncbi:MAG: T9SS type A sorting domain-containing protein [Ignavibacteria bacterium]|nr:T9SS type A sorting domain-containing protein [Ignavibacteria bacterium]